MWGKGGEGFLEKAHTPIPPLPKTFDGWGGHATGVRSNLKFFKGRAKQVPFPVAMKTANP